MLNAWDYLSYKAGGVVCRVLKRHTRACRGRFDHLAGSLNQLPRKDTFTLPNGQVLQGVHPPTACAGRGCPIHHPATHHMVAWPLLWRGDRGFMERTCTHSVGHPDPDDWQYHLSVGRDIGSHGCCGCCLPPMPEAA